MTTSRLARSQSLEQRHSPLSANASIWRGRSSYGPTSLSMTTCRTPAFQKAPDTFGYLLGGMPRRRRSEFRWRGGNPLRIALRQRFGGNIERRLVASLSSRDEQQMPGVPKRSIVRPAGDGGPDRILRQGSAVLVRGHDVGNRQPPSASRPGRCGRAPRRRGRRTRSAARPLAAPAAAGRHLAEIAEIPARPVAEPGQ